jgi:hypothetical protein
VVLVIGLPIEAIAQYIFPALALLSFLTVANRVRAGLRPAA